MAEVTRVSTMSAGLLQQLSERSLDLIYALLQDTGFNADEIRLMLLISQEAMRQELARRRYAEDAAVDAILDHALASSMRADGVCGITDIVTSASEMIVEQLAFVDAPGNVYDVFQEREGSV